MATYTIRWYYKEDVIRWEKLEAKGKLGAQQAQALKAWRQLITTYPGLLSMAGSRGRYWAGKWQEETQS